MISTTFWSNMNKVTLNLILEDIKNEKAVFFLSEESCCFLSIVIHFFKMLFEQTMLAQKPKFLLKMQE